MAHSTTNPPQSCNFDEKLPVIAGHQVAMDEHGRFNLNAIHHAAGSLPHKRPSQWARRDEAKDLVDEISQSADLHFEPLVSVRGGAYKGTYAHELLAISYAGWISPKFQLQVNQVFLDYRVGNLQASKRSSEASYHSTLIGTTIGTDGFRCLAAVLDGKLRHLPAPTRKRAKHHVWQQVHKAFSVVSAEDIPIEQMDSARNFVGAYTIEGEWLEAHSRTERLDIHYPVSSWKELNPNIALRPENSSRSSNFMVATDDLLGPPSYSPTMRALFELREAGYEVAACLKEVEAMRASLELSFDRLRQIQMRLDVLGRAHLVWQ